MPTITPDQHRESICTELETLATEAIQGRHMVRISADEGLSLLRPAAKLIREQHAEIERLKAEIERPAKEERERRIRDLSDAVGWGPDFTNYRKNGE